MESNPVVRADNHCGECGEFPCDILASMGVEAGYDPEPRLEQCRRWGTQSL